MVGGRKQAGPDCVDLKVGGPEHRKHAGGIDGAGKVAAQVCPSLARYLRPRRDPAVEGLAYLGKVERDSRRWLTPELSEAEDRRAQVAPAAVREAGITGKPVEDGLQRGRAGGGGRGSDFHRFALR